MFSLKQRLLALSLFILNSGALQAATQSATGAVRVVWDGAPDRRAVIGFSPNGDRGGAYLSYGDSTREADWSTLPASPPRDFQGLASQFVRLSGLRADTPYYFRVCDEQGCGPRYWFQTAPATPSPLSFITGGDSRTDHAARLQGNRLVAKLRPRFVMFGGDYTDANTGAEMAAWLDDWSASFSKDRLNGVAYQQIHPLIPTVGNHEAYSQLFMCTVFGVDADEDGRCDYRDTYGAFNVAGGLLRIYTLNTELALSGYEARWQAQSRWLREDLAGAGQTVVWRIGQYHRPMLPRSSSKPAVNAAMLSWAAPFYEHKMNLAIESDSHLVKYTYPVRPTATGYQRSAAGTVYIGEGAWGAPRRAADRQSSWIADQDSFAHLNLVQVHGAELTIRTVYFSGEAQTEALGRTVRAADPLALPEGLALWEAAGVGTHYRLQQDRAGRSAISRSGSRVQTAR